MNNHEEQIINLISNLKTMLTEKEIQDLENYIIGLDKNLDKELGKKLVIDYINELVKTKIEEESNKIIRYYEKKMEEQV